MVAIPKELMKRMLGMCETAVSRSFVEDGRMLVFAPEGYGYPQLSDLMPYVLEKLNTLPANKIQMVRFEHPKRGDMADPIAQAGSIYFEE